MKTFGPRGTVHLLPAADLGRVDGGARRGPATRARSPTASGCRRRRPRPWSRRSAGPRGRRPDGRRADRGGRRPGRRLGGGAGDAGVPDAVAALAAGDRPRGVRRRAVLRPGPRPQGHLHAAAGHRLPWTPTRRSRGRSRPYLRGYGPATPASFAPWFGCVAGVGGRADGGPPRAWSAVELDGEPAFDLPDATYDAAPRRGRAAAAVLRRVRGRQPPAAPAVPGPGAPSGRWCRRGRPGTTPCCSSTARSPASGTRSGPAGAIAVTVEPLRRLAKSAGRRPRGPGRPAGRDRSRGRRRSRSAR